MTDILRLIVSLASLGARGARFAARLEGSGDLLVISHQPMVDGARALLEQGHDPSQLATMRHEGKAFDSFLPMPLGEWAKWSYAERDRGRLAREPWQASQRPIARPAMPQK